MQIRCYNCHRPFALGRDAVHVALQEMSESDMSHYNAFCPHCGRANRVSRKELQRAAPDWKPESQVSEQGDGTT
jgi:RNase P subunit RPR2